MSDNVTAIKGFADLFSPDSDAFTHMEAVARETFSRYGFTELRTPILERTELFCRGIGTETDVVQKEMYTFPDRKGRSLTLRPEATAGVMRAYIESGRSGDAVTKLFTIGPMFRYERPQKGRMRQFHQINCECLGPSEPYADAELVTMAMRFLEALGLKDLSLQLNSLGCPTCRPAYRETLRKWLSELDESALCEDCRRRMVTNPLRVLDCKVPSCREHTAEAPKILDHNCPDCAAHFETVRRLLDAEKVPYVINHRLVRGLDYYTRTTLKSCPIRSARKVPWLAAGVTTASSNSSAAPTFPASVRLRHGTTRAAASPAGSGSRPPRFLHGRADRRCPRRRLCVDAGPARCWFPWRDGLFLPQHQERHASGRKVGRAFLPPHW